jgi:hypothetical protein
MRRGIVAKFSCPQLYYFARNKRISLLKAASQPQLHSCFHLPMSTEAFQQYNLLLNQIEDCNLSNDKDVWTYIWGKGFYSSQKARRVLKGHQDIHLSYKWLWKRSCNLKHKIFVWLLLKHRLSIRELLQRKSMHLYYYNYVLCNEGILESAAHLFLHCTTSIECWNTLNLHIDPSSPCKFYNPSGCKSMKLSSWRL